MELGEYSLQYLKIVLRCSIVVNVFTYFPPLLLPINKVS